DRRAGPRLRVGRARSGRVPGYGGDRARSHQGARSRRRHSRAGQGRTPDRRLRHAVRCAHRCLDDGHVRRGHLQNPSQIGVTMPSIRAIAAAVLVLAAVRLSAQQPAAPPAKPDSGAVVQRIAALRNDAGSQWAEAVHFWCEAPRANRADDPVIEPAKIFDNVYAIGSIGTVAYVVQTSAGLMMIDALSANEVESRLLPGFA